ncbi:MAG: hypothetical protein AB1461_15515 [Thermodesulfobacteriota bacterium]
MMSIHLPAGPGGRQTGSQFLKVSWAVFIIPSLYWAGPDFPGSSFNEKNHYYNVTHSLNNSTVYFPCFQPFQTGIGQKGYKSKTAQLQHDDQA